jgi:transcription-repair coupling factor (superfamily II helicase)
VASSERRADETARALAGLAPEVETLILPPWDCLPFDRASPSREAMGRRMRTLRTLAEKPKAPRIVVLSPESLVQRLPPADVVCAAFREVRVGETLDRDALRHFADRTGYVADDRIDEPGEIALLGEVVDIFPADAVEPVRILLGPDDRIVEMRTYDPISQRSQAHLELLTLAPASEYVLSEADDPSPDPRPAGIEHRLAEHYGRLSTIFDILPRARLAADDRTDDRLAQLHDQIIEAFEARRDLGLAPESAGPAEALYLTAAEGLAGLAAWARVDLDLVSVGVIPSLAGTRNPGRAFCDLVSEHRAAGTRVVLTGLDHERRPLQRALVRGLDVTAEAVPAWASVMDATSGAVLALDADLETGFVVPEDGVAVIAAPDVLGGRLAERRSAGHEALNAEQDLRLGDVVLHEDHGVGVLRDLEVVEVDGVARDTLRIAYHGGASILAPVDDLGRIWRYGAEEAAVTLDRLGGEAWPKRRAEVSRHVEAVAQDLVALARARAGRTCAPIRPPRAAYAQFAVGFAYPETADQAAAIEAVLDDLASGRPMDRLVCGDVGFGKTEVALRAAAAVALSGRQVAVVAPTTVLARQHYETLRRRFAGSGVAVAQLSRLVGSSEADAVRQAVAAGEVGILVGTHAVASDKVAFADLGLVIVDEEQKFGAAMKSRLRDLAGEGHLLALTATPIPRTLQAAMVGLQDVSVIATPPARRRPIRTFLAPFDAASVRMALMRERRRGGQSFFVVPRIEDIAPLAARLSSLAPELSICIAHGGLAPEAADEVMVGFAEGRGDVLLATNIIESGLDVPRANTMLIWRPERFGLSQLHQLRGRVGRGRAQGIAYLLADPDGEVSEATRARLSTLEAFDRLGAGLAISARDLDLRGGGDLVGEEQAGHMRMIGAALYQRLLDRAIRLARGEALPDALLPVLQTGETGAIPPEHVPDPITRINLYARLARLETVSEIDAFEAELDDRFGANPPAVAVLLDQARLQRVARDAGVRHVGAGPKGVALTFRPGAAGAAFRRLRGAAVGAMLKADRIVVPRDSSPQGVQGIEGLLARLG